MKAKERNPKEAANVIAKLILPNEDWQLGKTKIFLKVGQFCSCSRVFSLIFIEDTLPKNFEEVRKSGVAVIWAIVCYYS